MKWFEAYTKRLESSRFKPPYEGERFACPCCGYLTLPEAGSGEICELCLWEDNGQDDAHAEELWYSTNGYYSLARARENFGRYGVMYEPEGQSRLVGGADSAAERSTKRELIAAFNAMPGAPDDAALAALWKRALKCERRLDDEIDRRISDFRARNPEYAAYEAALTRMMEPD